MVNADNLMGLYRDVTSQYCKHVNRYLRLVVTNVIVL